MSDIIRVKGLVKRYAGFTLEGIDFALPRGAVVGCIGENGAGKSTTVKSMLGLITPSAGSVEIFGKEAKELSREERGKVGTVLGEGCLPFGLRLKELQSVLRGMFLHWDDARFCAYCQKFALPLDKKIKDLSAGMRQKAAVAAALSHGAELLVLDEPAAGLDPVARDEMLDILYDFMQDEGHGVFISSHILSDLEKLCDYILFIHAGKQVFFEEKDALYEKYGILRCGQERLRELPQGSVVSVCRGEYGAGALVRRDLLGKGMCERASIEDIMLYLVKGERL